MRLDQNGEEARIITRKIFTFIKSLAEQGLKVESFWERRQRLSDNIGFGEIEYILEVCDFLLQRLDNNTFYAQEKTAENRTDRQ